MSVILKNTNNELIIKRRRKKAIKRNIIFFILLISIIIVLCLKIPYFDVSNIVVSNNKIINTNEILDIAKVSKGSNIFYMDLKKIEGNILKNPYILKANVKRKLPNTIYIAVEEREAVFYIKSESRYLIIDNKGIVLEEKDDISNMNLTKLLGFEAEGAKIGEVIPCDDNRKIEFISLITDLIMTNKSNIKITAVDISDILDIKVYSNNMSIKLGSNNDVKSKLNLAFNIINDNNLINLKGYVDVRFESNPSVFVEK
ncbi:cell division protein FtsQ [Clostridium sp. USBA 49]|uniref:cell division protein FtsQ/DivIB n=1 Tax=Clostridium sp. USBA 49 TaxID=1881060 RepID=UPI0009D5CD99|nr:FtsQ-type POTRA domain-containing protein [Clostridium sp. USBA 49]SKA77011.1 cell division protein FtsQ [Clostridium sp. USBA 49]